MTRKPGDNEPEPPGGRAAERRRQFLSQRYGDEAAERLADDTAGAEDEAVGAADEAADANAQHVEAPDDEQPSADTD